MANEINFTPIVLGAAGNAETINAPLRQLDAAIKLNKWDATSAPTVNDDSTDGYSAGSRWLDVSNGAYYVCQDPTPGAAVWLQFAPATQNIDLTVTAGENLSERDYVYLQMDGDNKWYQVDIDASPPEISVLRGVVVEGGGILQNNTGDVRVFGEVTGFAGGSFDAGKPVYAHTTAGGLTKTKPSIASGEQKAIVKAGIATGSTVLFVQIWHPVEYVKRNSALANGSSITVEHHSDPQAKSRDVAAFAGTTEAGESLREHDPDILDYLKGWWRLDEPGGTNPTVRPDSHGSLDLSDINTVGYNPIGKVDDAADLELSDSTMLRCRDDPAVQGGNKNFTVAFWFKRESLGTGQALVTKFETDPKNEWLFHLSAANQLGLYIYDGSATIVTQVLWSTALTSTTNWYFVVGWHDADDDKVGLLVVRDDETAPGSPQYSSAYSGTPVTTTARFAIGAYAYGTAYFDGCVDEVAKWDRLLTSTEMTWLYNYSGGVGHGRRYPLEPVYLKALAGSGGTTDIDTAGTHIGQIGNAAGTQYELSQSFQVTAGQLTQLTFTLGTIYGSPTGGITWEIRTDDGSGKPSTTLLATGLIDDPVSSAENVVYLTDGPFLAASTAYHLVLKTVAQSSGNYWRWLGEEPSVYADGYSCYSIDEGSSWTINTARDYECAITTSASTTKDRLAQAFHLDSAADVGSVKLYLKKYGTPTGNLTVKIETDNSNEPSGTPVTNGTSNTVAASSLSTSPGWITFTFATPPSLSGSTKYWIVLETTDSAGANCLSWISDYYGDYTGYTMKVEASSTWTDEVKDALFKVLGEDVTYEEPCVIGRHSAGTRDVGVRFDDGAGANGETNTTFKNVSGATLDLTCVVELS